MVVANKCLKYKKKIIYDFISILPKVHTGFIITVSVIQQAIRHPINAKTFSFTIYGH